MTKQELINYFGVSKSTIDTNFPVFCQKQLAKGFLITRIGVGAKANYTVEKVEPQIVDKSYFSQRKNETTELDNELWIPSCVEGFEASNLGRVRNATTKIIHQGSTTKEGYRKVSINNKPYLLHRFIQMSFCPIDDPDNWTVNHINGIRSDNRPENLEWVSNENNIMEMLLHRSEMNKELTRIINKIGYNETLKLLQSL